MQVDVLCKRIHSLKQFHYDSYIFDLECCAINAGVAECSGKKRRDPTENYRIKLSVRNICR